MRLYNVRTESGDVYLNEEFADKDKDYTHTFHADDELHPHPLYPGYKKVLSTLIIPGVPIKAKFIRVKEWDIFQPAGYKFDNAYTFPPAEVRGTLGLRSASAWHIVQMGVFNRKESKTEIYETPNTPMQVYTYYNTTLGVTSITNEPARYAGNARFILGYDFATFGDDLKLKTDVLAFVNDEPKTVNATIYGMASGSFGDKSIFTPLQSPPPEKALFTGSTTGTSVMEYMERLKDYTYMAQFGKSAYAVTFRNGWLYHGVVKPGDSGGPLFRIVAQQQTGPQESTELTEPYT
jgi:hypothetical protein